MKEVKIGNKIVGGKDLFLLAGPCVIEDVDRVLKIGHYMKDVCERLGITYVFKASFDKANRSSYSSFRGPGIDEGLKNLAHVKKELNVPIVSDIHAVDQV